MTNRLIAILRGRTKIDKVYFLLLQANQSFNELFSFIKKDLVRTYGCELALDKVTQKCQLRGHNMAEFITFEVVYESATAKLVMLISPAIKEEIILTCWMLRGLRMYHHKPVFHA